MKANRKSVVVLGVEIGVNLSSVSSPLRHVLSRCKLVEPSDFSSTE